MLLAADRASRGWITIDGTPALRCWWSPAAARDRVVLVLPEVFGVNEWVRDVADHIASVGVCALAMPLFARTAPELDLGYSDVELAKGRRHKEATSTDQIQADAAMAIAWLQQMAAAKPDPPSVTVVGFCFGGHAALLTAVNVSLVFSVQALRTFLARSGHQHLVSCKPLLCPRQIEINNWQLKLI